MDHGGPVIPHTLDTLSNLNEKQLLQEIPYLRQTIAQNIRQMRHVKTNGKYKMERFTTEELKTLIRNALRPEDNVSDNICNLLLNAL